MATKRERRQLKIVVAMNIALSAEDTAAASDADAPSLHPYFDLAREYINQFENDILMDFAPLALVEFGSVVEAFDCLTRVRTVISDLSRSQSEIQTRFSCYIGEVSGNSPLLENSVVRRSVEMLEAASWGEVIVSDTVYGTLGRHQALFEKFDDRSFVIRAGSDMHRLDPSDGTGEEDGEGIESQTDMTIVGVSAAAAPDGGDPPDDRRDPTIVGGAEDIDRERGDAPPAENPLIAEILSRSETAINAGDTAACYEALGAIEKSTSAIEPAETDALDACREQLEAALGFSEPAALVLQNRPNLLFFSNAIEIGRRVASPYRDIHVGCRLVSQTGRQARIEFQDHDFRVSDLGSTNGTFLEDRHVHPGEWIAIPPHARIKLGGGLKPPRPGPCVLACRYVAGNPASMLFEFETGHLEPEEMAALSENWRTIHLDGAYRWILAPGSVQLGQSSECAIRSPAETGKAAARISVKDRCYIEPVGGADLTIEGVSFRSKVVLADNIELVLNGAKIRFSSAANYFAANPPGVGI